VVSGVVVATVLVASREGKNIHDSIWGGQHGTETLKLPQTPFQPQATCSGRTLDPGGFFLF